MNKQMLYSFLFKIWPITKEHLITYKDGLAILFCLGAYLRCQAMAGNVGILMVLVEILIFIMVAIYAAFVKHTSWEGKDSSIFSPRKSLIITTLGPTKL